MMDEKCHMFRKEQINPPPVPYLYMLIYSDLILPSLLLSTIIVIIKSLIKSKHIILHIHIYVHMYSP